MDIMEALSGDEAENNELKELKVKLPLRHHIRLHSLKLVRKEPISDTVMKALTDYFDRLEAEYEARGSPTGLPGAGPEPSG